MSENDPSTLDKAKENAIKGGGSSAQESHSSISHAPSWQEDAASQSEAVIKAEREQEESSVEDMQNASVETVKKKHHH